MFHFSLISYRYNFRSSHWRRSLKKGVLKNFANFIGKHMPCRLFFINLQVWGLQLYWKEIATQRCLNVLKNTNFEEHLRMTITIISKSWMHSFIQIFLYQKGIRTIALEENCPPPVRVRASFRVEGQFSSGTTQLS